MAQITICPKPCACCGDSFYNTDTQCCVGDEPIIRPDCEYCIEYLDINDCTCKLYTCTGGEIPCGGQCCPTGFVCGIDCTCIPEGNEN